MKKLVFGISAVLALCALSAFDWPQNEIFSDSFYSYFAQLRGGTINTSLVFSESREVKAADAGHVVAVLSEHDEDEIFESTLGNAAVIAHADGLMTVYANLDAESQQNLFSLRDVESGDALGNTSNSGWQEGEACLEFQVLDIKNRTYVNPRILMPRIGKELELTIRNVTAVSKNGTSFNLGTQKILPAGIYTLYRERQNIAMPYKTTVYINGAAAESLSYDVLTENDGTICLNGKKKYDIRTVYPAENRQLLGEVSIPRGRNTISIVVADILGKERQLTYTVDAR